MSELQVPWLSRLPGADAERMARSDQPGIACVFEPLAPLELELALRATLIIAAPAASFRGGGCRPPSDPQTPCRLGARLGSGGAFGFWLDPNAWPARRAFRSGLIDRLDPDPWAVALAISGLWRKHPPALLALLRLAGSAAHLDPTSALRLERARFALTFSDDRPRLGARAFFETPRGSESSGG